MRAKLGFGGRLAAATVLALAVVGVVGYFVMLAHMRENQIARYSAIAAADARGLEQLDRSHSRSAEETGQHRPGRSLHEIDELLDVLGRRPGTLEVVLVDSSHVIRASGTRTDAVGTRAADPRLKAALERGTSYGGQESGPGEDQRNFEFVYPVDLTDGRYALAMTYDPSFLESTEAVVRRTLAWMALIALGVGGSVFYLVGGRSLMRSHRIALKRATRDGLTDLPNHGAFQDDLKQAVAAATRYEEPLTLALLDLDDFKFLNDRHGHPHGDALLRRAAETLRDGRVADRAYRIGGDEFAMLLPRTDKNGARALVRRLSGLLTDAEMVLSVGVSDLRPGKDAEALRAEADAALYEAKRRGGHDVVHFDEIRNATVIMTSGKSDAVRSLIDERGLTTVFQPIWDLDGAVLLGVEALTRPDPQYGLVGPLEAFDIADQIGRVHDLDVLCVQSALAIAPELPDDALVFMNLSPQTLDLDAAGDDWLREAVDQALIPPGRVVIEVTERFGGRTSSITKRLRHLRDQGFKLALDDVGTGNSGLQMLREVDPEFVKIDRSIVSGAATDPVARAVLMAMATYAGETGAYVIAEGIEDEDTLDFVRAIAHPDARTRPLIQGGQGYGLGRPGPEVAYELPGLLQQPSELAAARASRHSRSRPLVHGASASDEKRW